MVIVNICVHLIANAWKQKKKASASLFTLAKAAPYIQCILSFCSKLKISLEKVMSGGCGELLPRVRTSIEEWVLHWSLFPKEVLEQGPGLCSQTSANPNSQDSFQNPANAFSVKS